VVSQKADKMQRSLKDKRKKKKRRNRGYTMRPSPRSPTLMLQYPMQKVQDERQDALEMSVD